MFAIAGIEIDQGRDGSLVMAIPGGPHVTAHRGRYGPPTVHAIYPNPDLYRPDENGLVPAPAFAR